MCYDYSLEVSIYQYHYSGDIQYLSYKNKNISQVYLESVQNCSSPPT